MVSKLGVLDIDWHPRESLVCQCRGRWDRASVDVKGGELGLEVEMGQQTRCVYN